MIAKNLQKIKELNKQANKQGALRQKEFDHVETLKSEAFALEKTAKNEEDELDDLEMNIPFMGRLAKTTAFFFVDEGKKDKLR